MNINSTLIGQMFTFAIFGWFTMQYVWPAIEAALKDRQKKISDGLDKVEEECVRCGEHLDACKCPEEDPWSTQVYHRAPKGKEYKGKPKQEFKK